MKKKIGIEVNPENSEDGDIITHTYVNTECETPGFSERVERDLRI